MFSQCVRIRLGRIRGPHQRAGVCPQREKIGPEFIVQLPGNFLAFGILQGDRGFSQPPLLLHGIPQGRCKMVQLGADRRQFG